MTAKIVNALFLLAALMCIVYYIALGVSVRFGQSLDFMWLVFAGVFLVRFVLKQRAISLGQTDLFTKISLHAIHIGLGLFLVSLIAVEAVIVSAFSGTVPANLDYIIVLGAKVNGTQPGGALRNRIQVASEYLKDNPDTVVIASGGKGSDEGISEAECIRVGLLERHVKNEIRLEDQSTSTYENLEYSLKMIEDSAEKQFGIVTNDFHLYRALKIARDTQEGSFYGIRVATSPISFPHYMLREYFAVLHGFVTGNW